MFRLMMYRAQDPDFAAKDIRNVTQSSLRASTAWSAGHPSCSNDTIVTTSLRPLDASDAEVGRRHSWLQIDGFIRMSPTGYEDQVANGA